MKSKSLTLHAASTSNCIEKIIYYFKCDAPGDTLAKLVRKKVMPTLVALVTKYL